MVDAREHERERRHPLNPDILSLIEKKGPSPHTEFIHDIIYNALRLIEEETDRSEVKLLNTALKELRYAFKVFAPYRQIRKVTIFGSARTQPNTPAYKQAMKFARQIVKKGFMVITGAAGGIMEAGNRGAGKEKSFGVNIRLPWEQLANPIVAKDPKLITFRYFFTRKLIFVKETDAVVLFPGGYGTHDEGFELLTLVQTGKSVPIPIVFMDEPGGTYWKNWHQFINKQMVRRGMINREDLSLFKITDDVNEACQEILRFYKNYHSLRFVRDKLVIRMHHSLTPKKMQRLNRDFKDILLSGEVKETVALPEEHDEVELRSNPRLIFAFNRRSFGRLRELIDAINE